MDNTYNPSKTEDEIYNLWIENNAFSPTIQKNSLDPFTIIMPPPNVTGELHMGHALTIAIEDLMIRWKRMERKARIQQMIDKDLDLRDRWAGIRELKKTYTNIP